MTSLAHYQEPKRTTRVTPAAPSSSSFPHIAGRPGMTERATSSFHRIGWAQAAPGPWSAPSRRPGSCSGSTELTVLNPRLGRMDPAAVELRAELRRQRSESSGGLYLGCLRNPCLPLVLLYPGDSVLPVLQPRFCQEICGAGVHPRAQDGAAHGSGRGVRRRLGWRWRR